jgi:hypothetical protein
LTLAGRSLSPSIVTTTGTKTTKITKASAAGGPLVIFFVIFVVFVVLRDEHVIVIGPPAVGCVVALNERFALPTPARPPASPSA